MLLSDILNYIKTSATSPTSGERNADKFKKCFDSYIATVKAELALYQKSEDAELELYAHETLQVSSKLAPAYYAWVPTTVLFAQLSACYDQTPVSHRLVKKLFDDPELGLFKVGKFLSDVEVAVCSDNIDDEGEIVNINEVFIAGGRHRLTALSIILEALLDDESIKNNQVWRCRPITVNSEQDVPLMQKVSNTSRSMGSTEKARVRVVNDSADVVDLFSLVSHARNSTSSAARTDVYRAIFAYYLPDGTTLSELNLETLGSIGAAFFSAMKQQLNSNKEARALMLFGIKYNIDEQLFPFHSSIVDEAWKVLPSVIVERKEQGVTNIARDYRTIAQMLAERVIQALALTEQV